MTTSKLPIEVLPVPGAVVAFAARTGKAHAIACNLRPEQRPPVAQESAASRFARYHCGYWAEPLLGFLKSLRTPCRVAIHFQGYTRAKGTGTVIVRLTNIYWAENGTYPRLDFVHPPGMDRVNSCPNFWVALVLAIGLVDDALEDFAEPEDSGGFFFLRTIETHGVALPTRAA